MEWIFEDGREGRRKGGPGGPRTRWEVEGLAPEDRRDHWLPVVVRLSGGEALAPEAENLLRAEAEEVVRLPLHEAGLLRAQVGIGPRSAGATALAYCRPEAIIIRDDGPDVLSVNGQDLAVLHVGAPVAGEPRRRQAAGAEAGPGPAVARGEAGPPPDRSSPAPPPAPVLAVIDDAIGFLHGRFRAPDGHTRFRAVWLQAAGWRDDHPFQGGLPGRVIEAAEIDDLIALGDEARAYGIVNDGMVPPGGHRATERRAGHGTHVLDLAAGAGPGGAPGGAPDDAALAACPLLAVQLPPGALALTAGRQLDGAVVAGLRWIMARALPPPGEPAAPLIVTLSVGSFGKAQDGTSWLERQVADVIEDYRLLSQGQPMRVVVAFGNARRARAVARAPLAPGEAVGVDWRILPDDRTDSWLALRALLGADVAVSLVPPAGLPELHLPAALAPGATWTLRTTGGQRLAEVFGEHEAGHQVLRLAVEATARDDGHPAAPSGAWRVVARNRGAETTEVSLRVERDDTPHGYRLRGRQSWLDHPNAWTWEAETGGWTGPGGLLGGPVTRAGTGTDLAGLRHGGLYLVAGGERLAGDGRLVPTRISSEGGPGQAACPTLLARSDDGRVRPGRRAAGVLTGSTARMGGTSVAAPAVARALARLALDGGLVEAAGDEPAPAELEALIGGPPGPPDPRRGRGALSEPLP